MKYPINQEFFPFSCFAPPVQNAKMAGWMGSMMRPPRWIWRDREVSVRKETIKGYQNGDIQVFLFEPKHIPEPTACLVYYHGGGFFFEGASYHYKLAKEYALKTPCKVVFVQYRLAPKHPHPIPAEDSYAALRWTFDHADMLNIDKKRIAVGGDSAGGALAAAVCQMARDRGTDLPYFQLLIYPVTDRRMQTESNKTYIDTPMWNSKLSRKMWPGYLPDPNTPVLAYASPMEAKSFADLPNAYIETAEFDCLRDEGVAYANALKEAGVSVTLHQTKGTMHGFDIVEKAPTTRMAVRARIQYMKNPGTA